jgi:integration host factor subunit alpha
MGLTKKDFVEMVYRELGISKIESTALVESFFEIIKDELAKGNEVMISGFGKWSVKQKNARNGRNPQTGGNMTITARKIVTFRSAEKLKSVVNHGSNKIKGG